MKNTISSPFIIISTSLLMLIMNIFSTTTCSEDWNYNNSLDTFDSSPWNAPEFNDEYNSNEHTEEDTSNTDYAESSKSVKKSKPSSNSSSGNYMFNREGGKWRQNTVEQMFVNSDPDWPPLEPIRRRQDKLLKICRTFKWLSLKPGYKRMCNDVRRFGIYEKLYVILITLDNKVIKNRIMLSCTCFNRAYNNSRDDIDTHTFTIAYHTDRSYFLLNSYPQMKYCVYIMGYVDNIDVPYK